MYRTCAFCNGKLDGDGGPSGLGVGRRLAFDGWKGRLWVICSRCSRWNLAPLDDRLERIEALARAATDGRVAAATDQVALIRWHGYDLVRVGKPRRLELATWRYGERLRARRQEQLKFVVPMTVAAVGLAVAVNVAAGGSVGVFVWNTPRLVKRIYLEMVGRRKIAFVEPPICERCGSVMLLRARHLERARVTMTARDGMALLLTCPSCGAEGTMLTCSDAQFALRRGLTYLNLARGGWQRAEDAARLGPRGPLGGRCRMTMRTQLGVSGWIPPRGRGSRAPRFGWSCWRSRSPRRAHRHSGWTPTRAPPVRTNGSTSRLASGSICWRG